MFNKLIFFKKTDRLPEGYELSHRNQKIFSEKL